LLASSGSASAAPLSSVPSSCLLERLTDLESRMSELLSVKAAEEERRLEAEAAMKLKQTDEIMKVPSVLEECDAVLATIEEEEGEEAEGKEEKQEKQEIGEGREIQEKERKEERRGQESSTGPAVAQVKTEAALDSNFAADIGERT